MKKRKLLLIVSVCLIALIISACAGNNHEEEKQGAESKDTSEAEKDKATYQLSELLPDDSGYVWSYDGSVEYGHEMELIEIEETEDERIYKVEGTVDDASGGESPLDHDLNVVYTVTKDFIKQEVDGEAMMDHIFPELELIREPLLEGESWTQTQVNEDGKEITLKTSIESIEEEEEQKVYTVLYEDTDSDYYEKRKIKEGVGVISFEYLYIFEEDQMPMGYEINSDGTGYDQ